MKIRTGLRLLGSDQRGLSTVEYVVLLVLILAGAISLWREIGGGLKTKLTGANKEFQAVQQP